MHKKQIAFMVQGGKGGTLEYIKALLDNLDKEKYEITVICQGEVYEELNKLNFKTYYVEMTREISIFKDFMSFVNIMMFLIKNKTDIVYSHSSKAGFMGRLAAGILKIPNIYNPHGWSFNMKISNRKKLFYIFLEKAASFFADKIIMISEAEYNDAVSKKIAKEGKIILITNGIDLKKFDRKDGSDFKRKLSMPDYKVIGMIGRLTDQKSPQTFIKTAKIVFDSYPDCIFILIGDGELKAESQKLVQSLELGKRFIFTGWVENIEEYISIMDVGVLTSQWEGFGLVLAEMMACGKPVVASKVDGIPFVIDDNIDGFLCDPGDVQQFAACILRLMNNDDLYKTMSESAYKHAHAKFDIKRVVKQHEEIFNSL